MACPKCRATEVRRDVPALGKANACQQCGWLELTAVTLESGMTTYECMKQVETKRQTRTPVADPSMHTCFMCGKTRERLNSAGVKLMLGIEGGICTDCVRLCQEVLEEVTAKTP